MTQESAFRHLGVLVLAATLLTTYAAPAMAGAGYADSKISLVRVDKSGRGYVVFAKAPTGTVAECRDTQYDNHLAFDTNTPGGRSVLAMVLLAHAQGAAITAYGTGTCTLYSGAPYRIEDWYYGYLQ